ncbi:hypothetical protein G7Y85_00175 [Solimonas terrae]|uniref:Glyoxalase-like domain-containing protein n=1 Tax=Solimonas terrae TaxID=1396819 RepID=A0A6M2BM44_9GAMM|nr:hypothetical protein [Solimonas terrae]
MDVRQLPPDEAGKCVELVDPGNHLHIDVQAVMHPSRVHPDIETDSIEAEVARLESPGARRLRHASVA